MGLTSEQIINQSNQETQEIIQKILKAKSAVVIAHVNPDGDTLGSMLALARVLEQAGIERVDRVMHDEVPDIYRFFPDQEKVLCSMKEADRAKTLDQYDLSFSCDCGSVIRLGSAGRIWEQALTTCNIDHHLSNPLYGMLNAVNPNATCTGQVVKTIADGLIQAGRKIHTDTNLASLYYITLLTDTGGFRHSNTNENVFKWAQELVIQGANPSELYHQLFNRMPFRAIKIIGAALNKIELLELKQGSRTIKLAYTYTTRAELEELGAKDEDTDEIVDHIMRIKDIDMCLYLREGKVKGKDTFKGSLRTAVDFIDCSKLAEQLNGGGHARAAGFNLDAESFDELKNRVLKLISSSN